MFIGRTDAEPEAPVFWPPDTKSWLIGKVTDAGKDWQQRRGTVESKMFRKHHGLNGHELNEFQGMLEDRRVSHASVHGVCKESDMT